MSSNFKKFITSRIFLISGSAVLVFILVILGRQYAQKSTVQKEVDDLSSQSAALQQKNQDLQNLLTYLQTSDYKQKAARQQLNLQRSGEVVYNFSGQNGSGGAGASGSVDPNAANPTLSAVEQNLITSGAASANQNQNQNLPNAKKWWNYFFHPGN